MICEILKYNDKGSSSLFHPSKKVLDFGNDLRRNAQDLIDTLKNTKDALGLAGPQIKINYSICAALLGGKIEILCNPKIVWKSQEREKMEEGCLSFPGIFLVVPRFKEIEVVYQDLNGNERKIRTRGVEARLLQHEVDHLEGTTFVERAEE